MYPNTCNGVYVFDPNKLDNLRFFTERYTTFLVILKL